MDAKAFRKVFLDTFNINNHSIIGGASIIPENDPSVLFTTAGMHPLVPFLLGEPHPAGKRLANCQKCLRTGDIMEVGDDVHLTFFEMLGNWSLGDYWKPDAIMFSYQFLTEVLGFEHDRLHVTCFEGDDTAPKDYEALEVWKSIGIPENHITFLPKKDNWWGPAGETGPCGPDTEIFYDVNPDGPKDENPAKNPNRYWEVWNNVFMQYDKHVDGSFTTLSNKNVDTGLGLERATAILQGVTSLYETELFLPIIDKIMSLASDPNQFAIRVIADHIRASMFILAEGISPGNVDQPYIARRLIRRSVRYGREIGIKNSFMATLGEAAIPTLSEEYPELVQNRDHILTELQNEETRFQRTLKRGEKEFHKVVKLHISKGDKVLPGNIVFRLYDTYGFPPELTNELAAKDQLEIDIDGYKIAFKEHQEKSRKGAASRFRGGLSERSPETVKLHTATHLLHETLRRVLGSHVEQKGSNITVERLRFDFSHSEKMTKEQISEVEQIVNNQIQKNLDVTWYEMSVSEAQKFGAIGLFEKKYGEFVKVYSIGDYSKEICGGPHIENTGDLGVFKITKEQSVGSGIRRVRAILE